MFKNLQGRTTMVTGAARGIGRAISRAFLEAGARVALVDVDAAAGAETAEALGGVGGNAYAFTSDVRERAGLEAVVAEVERDVGPVDVMVNNAGIMSLGSFLDQTPQIDETQIAVNLVGVINGMRAVLPRMLQRGRGHVVNVASMAGRIGISYAASYSATKHAIVGLTEAVRGELRGRGIDFTYVMPAPVNTELLSGARRLFWPPVAEPEDVARAVVDAVRKGRLRVHVPESVGLLAYLYDVLPRRATDVLLRATGVQGLFATYDVEERARYIARTTAKRETKD